MKELLFLGDDSNEDDEEGLNYLAPLNDALRRFNISISQNNNNNNNNAAKRRRGNDSRPIPQQGFLDSERQTRLSFELHPSLLLHDLMIYQDVDFSANISDDEDEDDETEDGRRNLESCVVF
jgi:hypothetical protein